MTPPTLAPADEWTQWLAETATDYPSCRCQIPTDRPADRVSGGEARTPLVELGGGCTMPAYCCSRLDRLRLRLMARAHKAAQNWRYRNKGSR